jgi:hypothetical protein
MLLRLFQQQVRDQCQVVLVAAQQINAGLMAAQQINAGPIGPDDQDPLWVGCQNLVTGAGNVSKALWGQKGRAAAARKPLRDSLNVDDTSPFREVSMRNHFEHYDERLDAWWKESENHNHLDRFLGPPTAVAGFNDKEMFRTFDPATLDIVFWGERFNVQAIVTEAERIFATAAIESRKPHWETDPPTIPG